MRRLTEGSDTSDVDAVVGIVVGVGGGILLITGVLWCLYRRYGGLEGSLAGIPPERKMLVFTELGKMPDSAQRIHSRPGSARPGSARGLQWPISGAPAGGHQTPSNGAISQAVQAASASRPTSRPTSATLLPALSTGLEPGPLPTTPGSIASPRGHGRSLFSTMDPPRASTAGGLTTGAAGPSGAGEDSSRPGSASGRPAPHLRPTYTGGSGGGAVGMVLDAGAERPTSAGPRPSSSGLRPSSAGTGAGGTSRGWAAGAVTPSGGSGASTGGGGGALPPALVPTGSVTGSAWRGPLGVSELEPERSLNSVAGTMSPLEPFDGTVAGGHASGVGQGAAHEDGGAVPAAAALPPGAGGGLTGGRPPLPGRSGGAGGATTPPRVSHAGSAVGPGAPLPGRAPRSRPGSGGGPGGGAGGGPEPGGGGEGGSPLPGPSWQRHGGAVRTPRTSAGITRRSSTGVADDTMSTISGASSQFHSFSHAAEEPGGICGGGGGPPQHSRHLQENSLDFASGGASAMLPLAPTAGVAAAAAAGSSGGIAAQRSRLSGIPHAPGLGANTPVTCSPRCVGMTVAASQPVLAAAAHGGGGGGGGVGWAQRSRFSDGWDGPAMGVASSRGSASSAAAVPSPSSPYETDGGDGGACKAGRDGMGLETIPSLGVPGGGGSVDGSGGVAAGSLSPTQTSASQAAWAAAISLSSKLFGRGSRAGQPQA